MRSRFGETLFQLRHSKRLLQKTVAYDAEIDASYLAALENGRRPPPEPSTLDRIVVALGLGEREAENLRFLADLDRTILNLTKTTGSLRGGDCLIQLANALPNLSEAQLGALSTLINTMTPSPSMEEERMMK